MALVIGASISLDIENGGQQGYLDIDLSVQAGLLSLDVNLDATTSFPLAETVAGALDLIAPLPSLGVEVIEAVLPPIADPLLGIVDTALDALFPDANAPVGTTNILDLEGTILNLPGVFKI